MRPFRGWDGVLTLAVGDETGSYGLQLVLDDAAQSLTARLSTGFGAEKLDLLTMNYGTEDGGCAAWRDAGPAGPA